MLYTSCVLRLFLFTILYYLLKQKYKYHSIGYGNIRRQVLGLSVLHFLLGSLSWAPKICSFCNDSEKAQAISKG